MMPFDKLSSTVELCSRVERARPQNAAPASKLSETEVSAAEVARVCIRFGCPPSNRRRTRVRGRGHVTRKLVARVCRVLNGRASQIEVACRILHYGDQFI
jgi:hypothetical protein